MLDNRSRKAAACLLVVVAMAGCSDAPTDDPFEPNNTMAEATRLPWNEVFEARVNVGDPDVFVIDSGTRMDVGFSLSPRGGQNCPIFNVHGPEGQELLRQEPTGNCGTPLTELAGEGGHFNKTANGSYNMLVPVIVEGDHFLTIVEDLPPGDGDEPVGWAYRVWVEPFEGDFL